MIKVKDLVEVTVDSAFTLFPLDVERYELYVAAKNVVAGRLYSLPQCYDHADPRIRLFLIETEQLYFRAAFALQYRTLSPSSLLPGDHDRGRRLEASFTKWLPRIELDGLEMFDAVTLTHMAWRCFVRALSRAEALTTAVPNGRRIPT